MEYMDILKTPSESSGSFCGTCPCCHHCQWEDTWKQCAGWLRCFHWIRTLIFIPKPLGQVLWAQKGIVCWSLMPDVFPGYYQADGVFPTSSCHRFALRLGLDKIALLLNLGQLLSFIKPLDQNLTDSPWQMPAWPSCILPMTSLCCSLLISWSTSTWALHLRPVQTSTAALLPVCCLDSLSSVTKQAFSRLAKTISHFV